MRLGLTTIYLFAVVAAAFYERTAKAFTVGRVMLHQHQHYLATATADGTQLHMTTTNQNSGDGDSEKLWYDDMLKQSDDGKYKMHVDDGVSPDDGIDLSSDDKAHIEQQIELRTAAINDGNDDLAHQIGSDLHQQYRVVIDDYFKYWYVLYDYENSEKFGNGKNKAIDVGAASGGGSGVIDIKAEEETS